MSLSELWDQFTKTISQDASKGELARIINLIIEKRSLFILDIICFFLEMYHITGNLRAYTKHELLQEFKWKRSQLQFHLQKAIQQGIIVYHQRRYHLNTENILVNRIWKYYFDFAKLEMKAEDIERKNSLVLENEILREEVSSISNKLNSNYKTQIGYDLKEIQKEMNSILSDKIEHREALIDFWIKRKSFLLNFKAE